MDYDLETMGGLKLASENHKGTLKSHDKRISAVEQDLRDQKTDMKIIASDMKVIRMYIGRIFWAVVLIGSLGVILPNAKEIIFKLMGE